MNQKQILKHETQALPHEFLEPYPQREEWLKHHNKIISRVEYPAPLHKKAHLFLVRDWYLNLEDWVWSSCGGVVPVENLNHKSEQNSPSHTKGVLQDWVLSRVKGRCPFETENLMRNSLSGRLSGSSVDGKGSKATASNPKESYLIDVKRILKYLKGTLTLGLYYPKCPCFDLKGYLDLGYAGCNMEKKSTSGSCQILGGKLVCWSAKKHQSIAMSSAEAEYVAAAGYCANILWMKTQRSD
nr:uncharacterized mitochondrial protein AtMg00810-like [Tanacetum cinerariifolium]